MPGAAPLISSSGSSSAAQWHRWAKRKEIQLLGAMSKHAAAIPAAVGEDWESPYGFTPSELLLFLPPPPPNNLFHLTTFKLSNTTQEQSCDKRTGSQFLLECTQHKTLGKGETTTGNSNPITERVFSCRKCDLFPSGSTKKGHSRFTQQQDLVSGEWGNGNISPLASLTPTGMENWRELKKWFCKG